MTATITRFKKKQSEIYSNLSSLIDLAKDEEMIAFYDGVSEVANIKKYFRIGEYEKLQEQIKDKRQKMSEKAAKDQPNPGLYCYTPELGERKPKCQIEAHRIYFGTHHRIDTPLELKGRGIKEDGVIQAKNPYSNQYYKDGWHKYIVTEKAFEKLQEQYTISQEILLD